LTLTGYWCRALGTLVEAGYRADALAAFGPALYERGSFAYPVGCDWLSWRRPCLVGALQLKKTLADSPCPRGQHCGFRPTHALTLTLLRFTFLELVRFGELRLLLGARRHFPSLSVVELLYWTERRRGQKKVLL